MPGFVVRLVQGRREGVQIPTWPLTARWLAENRRVRLARFISHYAHISILTIPKQSEKWQQIYPPISAATFRHCCGSNRKYQTSEYRNPAYLLVTLSGIRTTHQARLAWFVKSLFSGRTEPHSNVASRGKVEETSKSLYIPVFLHRLWIGFSFLSECVNNVIEVCGMQSYNVAGSWEGEYMVTSPVSSNSPSSARSSTQGINYTQKIIQQGRTISSYFTNRY